MHNFLILLVSVVGLLAAIGVGVFGATLTLRLITDQVERWRAWDGEWNSRYEGYYEEHRAGEDVLVQWMSGTEGGLTGFWHHVQFRLYIANRWLFRVRYDAWAWACRHLSRTSLYRACH